MKSKAGTDTEFFRTEKIPKILLQIAPPVMLAQLIQAMYNIVDSFFVGKYSESALTALSVIYPLQLIIIALAVGTGVGVNTYMARLYAQKMPGQAEETAGTGTLLALGTWFIFAIFSIFCMRPYVLTSANTRKRSRVLLSTDRSSVSAASGHFWKETGRRSISRGAICTVRWSPRPWGR